MRSITERVARAADYARMATAARISSQLASDRIIEQMRSIDKTAAVARAVSAATAERDEAAARRTVASAASRAALVTILGETKKRLGAIRFTSRLVRAGAVGLRSVINAEIALAARVISEVVAAASIRSRAAVAVSAAAASDIASAARDAAAAELAAIKTAANVASIASLAATDGLRTAQSEVGALRALIQGLDAAPVRLQMGARPAPSVGLGIKRSRAEPAFTFVPLAPVLKTRIEATFGLQVARPMEELVASVVGSRTSRAYACLSLSATQPFGMRKEGT